MMKLEFLRTVVPAPPRRQRSRNHAAAVIALLYIVAIPAGLSRHTCVSRAAGRLCTTSTCALERGQRQLRGGTVLSDFTGGSSGRNTYCAACMHALTHKVPPLDTANLSIPAADGRPDAIPYRPRTAERTERICSTSSRGPPEIASPITATA